MFFLCLCSGDVWPSKQEPTTLHAATAAATVSLEFHLPLPAAGGHQPAPRYLPARWGGTDPLQFTAPPSRSAAGTEPSHSAPSSKPDRL